MNAEYCVCYYGGVLLSDVVWCVRFYSKVMIQATTAHAHTHTHTFACVSHSRCVFLWCGENTVRVHGDKSYL